MPDSSPPPVPSPTTTPAREQNTETWDEYRHGIVEALRTLVPVSDADGRIIAEAATALERTTFGHLELWQIIRQKERDAYSAANGLDVAELDARLCDLALENSRLRDGGAPSAPLEDGGARGQQVAYIVGYLAGFLTGQTEPGLSDDDVWGAASHAASQYIARDDTAPLAREAPNA